MKALTFPFKVTVIPAKIAMGFVGVVFAAFLNVFLTWLFISWGQNHFTFMHGVDTPVMGVMSTKYILEVLAFIMSISVAYSD